MRLKISHLTHYRYPEPVRYGLQQLRLTPKSRAGQSVLSWSIAVDGGQTEAQFEDHNNNGVLLVSLEAGRREFTVRCEGEVETESRAGVIGEHGGCAPLWLFRRETPLTRPGARIRQLCGEVGRIAPDDVAGLHGLAARVLDAMRYDTARTEVTTPAEDALATGRGVCQDHAHVFISAARLTGFPARYVSGYLLMPDREHQEAGHAWAEVYVQGLGWVGFDVSNAISPDDHYVRVATGLDYNEAAPVRGVRFGAGEETMEVTLQVQQ